MSLKRNTRRASERAATTVVPFQASHSSFVMNRLGSRVAVSGVAAAVAGILYCAAGGTAFAQQTAAATTASADTEVSALDEVVVTASANAVKKLDASYNIVSANIEQIKMANPKSTADVLKLSPGIWPESSGGQTGANIEIAGIPGGGDAPFFTNMINGTPLYGMPSLSFMDSSSLLRLDDTVDHVEIVQGGPGAVFGPGQMGATANFILKRGSAEPTGSVGLTYGTEGYERVDAFYGFPIAPGWYGSAGGFYRKSDGIRNPQFPADDGGQFTMTLSHDTDNGSFLIWARTLQDKNQFIVPIPVIQNGNGSYSNYPGFDSLTSAYGSYAIQHVTIPNPAGGFEDADLANGRGGSLNFLGFDYDADFNGWKVNDKFLWDGGSLNTNALFSGPNPRPLSYYEYGCQVAQPTGFCNGGTAVDSNNYSFPGASGLTGAPTPGSVTATYAGTGQPVAANQSVIVQGWWYIQKQLMNLNNDFRVSKEIFDGNTATGGVYATRYTDHDNWSLGNNMLMTNTPNARPIQLKYTAPSGQTYNLTSPNGFVNFNGNFNIKEDGWGTNVAPYLSDQEKIGGFLIDASVRYEHIQATQQTCNRTNQQLGSAFDLYEDAVPICNGTYDVEHYSKNATSWTAGVNYEITSAMSVYGRVNNGTHFDDFDNGIRGVSPNGNFSPVETLKNYEVGYKFNNQYLYLDLNAYHKQFTGLPYQQTNFNGVPQGPISNYGSDSKGVNFTGSITPFHDFQIQFTGDYMNGHYTHYNGCAPYNDINGNPQCAPIDGSPLQRQPKFQIRVMPQYKVEAGFADFTVWMTYEHVGQRYEDISGQQPLGSYNMVGAGLLAEVGQHWEVRLQGTNLNNEVALTEGNARIFGKDTGVNGVILGRPIEGREGNIGVKYKF